MRLCVSYSAAREVSNLAAEAACGKAWFMAWHCAEATVPAKAPMCDGPPLQSRMVGHLRGGAVQVPVSEPCAYLPQESLRPEDGPPSCFAGVGHRTSALLRGPWQIGRAH